MTPAPATRRARLAALLGALAPGHPCSLEDLSRATRMPLPLARRHLAELSAAGYAIHDNGEGRVFLLRLSHLPALAAPEAQLNLLRAALAPHLMAPATAADARALLDWADRALPGYLLGLDLDSLAADVLAPDLLAAARHLPLLHRAVAQRLPLSLAYRDGAGRASQRRVRPLGLERWGGRAWALIAWCDSRNDFRTFRLDRIVRAAADGPPFPAEPGRDLATFKALHRRRDDD